MSESEPQFLNLRLWDQSALVLFDWLLATDEDSLPCAHPAQKQALRDLVTALEWTRGLGYTEAEVSAAQDRVAKDMAEDDRSI